MSKGLQVHAVGNVHDPPRLWRKPAKSVARESADRHEHVGRRQALNDTSLQYRLAQPHILLVDITAMTGDEDWDGHTMPAQGRQVARRIQTVAMQHVKPVANIETLQEPAIPGNEETCREE